MQIGDDFPQEFELINRPAALLKSSNGIALGSSGVPIIGFHAFPMAAAGPYLVVSQCRPSLGCVGQVYHDRVFLLVRMHILDGHRIQ